MKNKKEISDIKKREPSVIKKDELDKIVGNVEITVRRIDTGEVEKVISSDNLIVTNLRTQLSRLLAGSTLGGTRLIDRLSFGTDGTSETITDTLITNPVDVSLSGTEYPTITSVKFTGTLGSADGNGVTFREVGLLFQNPAPFLGARLTFPPMQKSALWSYTVVWTLTFS